MPIINALLRDCFYLLYFRVCRWRL